MHVSESDLLLPSTWGFCAVRMITLVRCQHLLGDTVARPVVEFFISIFCCVSNACRIVSIFRCVSTVCCIVSIFRYIVSIFFPVFNERLSQCVGCLAGQHRSPNCRTLRCFPTGTTVATGARGVLEGVARVDQRRAEGGAVRRSHDARLATCAVTRAARVWVMSVVERGIVLLIFIV